MRPTHSLAVPTPSLLLCCAARAGPGLPVPRGQEGLAPQLLPQLLKAAGSAHSGRAPPPPSVLPLLVDSSSHIHLLPNEGPTLAGDYRWASDPEQVWGSYLWGWGVGQ